MKILVTIKAILNYLYNNLINLIWVKKIRFEDGTEMDSVPVGNNLYDIILLSQAIANNGWFFMGRTTRQDLSKNDVPTIYNDIKTKYDNCNSAPSSSYTNWLIGNFLQYTLCIDDTYIYATNTDQNQQPTYLKRTLKSAFPTTNWENTNIDVTQLKGYKAIEVGDNLIIFQARRQSQTNKIYVYKKSDLSFIKSIDIKNNWDNNNAVIHLINVNGIKTFFLSYKTENNNYVLSKMEDNVSATEIIIRTDLTSNIGLPAYDESSNTFWFWYNRYICKSSDEFQTIENIKSSTFAYCMDEFPSVYIKDNVIMFTSMNRLGSQSFYSENGGVTWNNVKNSYGNNINVGCLPYFDGETMYAQVWDSGYDTHIYKSTDLKTFTIFMSTETTGAGNEKIVYEPTKNTLFHQDGGNIRYLGIVKTVYTDTYTINGVNVNINYFKYDDWKICLPAGTNDTYLDTVYNFLGYLNYWRLDETNEIVSPPRNSNPYTFMYIGDNFLEQNLPLDLNYSAVALKSDLSSVGLPTISYFENNSGSTLDTNLLLGNAVMIFKNGLLLQVGQDYTLSGSIITFTTALVSSDKIAVINGVTSAIDLTNYKQKAEEIIINDTAITKSNILANKNYVFNSNAITSITLTACETSFEETTIEFSTGATAPTLTDNTGIVWVDGSAPALNANKSYLIVIFNNLGFVKEN